MRNLQRLLLMTWCLAALVATGCDRAPVDPETYSQAVAVEMAAVSLDSGHIVPPAPTPKPARTCPDCGGRGRVKTGDGIATTECDGCEGTGKVVRVLRGDVDADVNADSDSDALVFLKPAYNAAYNADADEQAVPAAGVMHLAAFHEPLPGYFPDVPDDAAPYPDVPAINSEIDTPLDSQACADGSCRVTSSGTSGSCSSGDAGAVLAWQPLRRTASAWRERRPVRRTLRGVRQWRPLRWAAGSCCQ